MTYPTFHNSIKQGKEDECKHTMKLIEDTAQIISINLRPLESQKTDMFVRADFALVNKWVFVPVDPCQSWLRAEGAASVQVQKNINSRHARSTRSNWN